MSNVDVRPIIFVGLLQTPYDIGDMIKVELEDGEIYHGVIQEIDMENCTIVMYKNPDKEEIVSFYIHQIKEVDESI